MQNLPRRVEPRDVSQWLANGWCLIDDVPCALNEVGGRGDPIYFTDVHGDTVEVAWEDRCTDIYAHWPLCGSLNLSHAKFAVYLERVAVRQYRRTYNHRALALSLPDKWRVMSRVGASNLAGLTPSTTHVVQAAFAAEYPEWDEALELLLDRGWGSVAINPKIILSEGNDGTLNVFYRGVRAGHINGLRFTPCGMLTGTRALKLLHGRVIL